TTLVNNGDGTYTYTSEDGTVTVVDVPATVVENFENIYNQIVNEQITVDGNTYNTFEEYIEYIANNSVNLEGSDFISVTGTGTATDPYKIEIKEGDDNSMLITNAAGELEWASIEEIVQANETLTTMSQDVNTGIITYTDEDGGESTANVVSEDAGNQIKVGTDGGAFYQKVNSIVSTDANYTVADGDETILIDATGGKTIT